MALKHVGRLKKTKRRVIVAYRVVPKEPDHCIVVTTENLMADEHDSLIKTVESDAGQTAYEFAEAMARATLPDGRNMLAGFHTTGKMIKVATSEVEMIPDSNTTISLDELNNMIAEQRGVAVEDLALQDDTPAPVAPVKQSSEEAIQELAQVGEIPVTNTDGVITDDELAAKYRSDADRLFKEAKRLREQAEELSPTKRATRKKAESV